MLHVHQHLPNSAPQEAAFVLLCHNSNTSRRFVSRFADRVQSRAHVRPRSSLDWLLDNSLESPGARAELNSNNKRRAILEWNNS